MGLFCENIRIKIGHYLNGLSKIKNKQIENKKPSEVTRVLILSDMSMLNNQQGISTLKKTFKDICPKISFTEIHFNSKVTPESETLISDKNREYFSEEDFSFFFKIRNQTVMEYLQNDYDIVFLLTAENHVYIDFLFQYAKGSLFMGRSGLSERLNFIVDIKTNDIKALSDAICKNYKMIFANN